MSRIVILLALVALSCQSGNADRIDIPGNNNITSEGLLTQIMDAASESPDDERLLQQELYYCEQLGWPSACGETLLKAKRQWGFSEKLIDQMVVYYLKHQNYDQLQSILKGTVETRPRLEAKIRIALLRGENIEGLMTNYLDHHADKEATVFALTQYLETKDTLHAIDQFELLNSEDSMHSLLRAYYPFLLAKKNHQKSIYIINNQLVNNDSDSVLRFDLALAMYGNQEMDPAKVILKKLGGQRVNQQLANWYRVERNWDSALVYIDKILIQNPTDRNLILAKAETLESKRWVTRSLSYYEQVLLLNPTDSVMAKRVEIVRRKVAYLRQIKERRNLPPALILKKKTEIDN